MSEILDAARQLRDRLAADASLAKDRAEYLRTVANWNDAVRLVDGLEAIIRNDSASDRDRVDAATVILDLHSLASETDGPACSTEGCA